MSLIAIGFWGTKEEGLIHPKYLVSPEWRASEKSQFANYLKSGVKLREYLGYAQCRLSPRLPDYKMGSADLTDGVYVWPEGLHVYVEMFNVKLPEEFVAHITQHEFACPIGIDRNALSKEDWNFEPWRKFCSAHQFSFSRRVFWNLAWCAKQVQKILVDKCKRSIQAL